jgi:pimeloyl-ACP methyl ester carboxylesterase
VVLSARQHEPFPDDFPPDLAVQIRTLVEDTQRELATLSSTSVHVLAEESGHFIHVDQPQVVIEAIRQVVEAVRAGTGS